MGWCSGWHGRSFRFRGEGRWPCAGRSSQSPVGSESLWEIGAAHKVRGISSAFTVFTGRYFPVALARTFPAESLISAFASKILSRRFATSSPVAKVSSPGRSGARKRAVSSAQYAKRFVCTAQAQTMISSSNVAMMPPCTTFLNPTCSGLGLNRVCTMRPSVSKRRFNPMELDSPQTKHECVCGRTFISPIGCDYSTRASPKSRFTPDVSAAITPLASSPAICYPPPND